MNPVTVVLIIVGVIVILLFFGVSLKPFKWLGRAAIKLAIGALLLFFLNVLGGQYQIHVPINLVTSSISGFLGIPGLCALVAIQLWIF
ncbi:pro-sigmaK processing inhibitor BofA family protein [Bacillaceae bacterium Marseille-Q3522]|nr:pro-sigmaK processing inhibitor BofA family protein [Bacillaceae bacterium Marseille-Q3522]